MPSSLLKIRPDSRAAHEGLAAAAFAAEDYARAAAHCAALVKVVPDSFEGWFNLGVALEKAGRPDAAKAYAEALRLRPNEAELHINLGVACQESGDKEKAKECYKRALELDPNSATALWNLALVLEQENSLPMRKSSIHTSSIKPPTPLMRMTRVSAWVACGSNSGIIRALPKPSTLVFGSEKTGLKRCSIPASPTGNWERWMLRRMLSSAVYKLNRNPPKPCAHWRRWRSSAAASKKPWNCTQS
jgi:hypothetical protein